MHTLKVLLVSFILLGLCWLVRSWIGGAVTAMKCFLVLWFIGTLINLWLGVSRAGYSVKEEAPVALLVFAVPAIVAVILWWKASPS